MYSFVVLWFVWQYVSSESVDMLKLLAKSGAPLDVRDPRGHTPLFYAKQQASGVMKKALVELLGEENAAQVRSCPRR